MSKNKVNISLSLEDEDGFEEMLVRGSNIRLVGIINKNLTQILNRARKKGGTPVDTGELRNSSKVSRASKSNPSGEMGYTKDYAFRFCGAYKTGQKRQKLSLRVA